MRQPSGPPRTRSAREPRRATSRRCARTRRPGPAGGSPGATRTCPGRGGPASSDEQEITIMNDDTHGDLNAILSDPGALVTGEPPLVLATNFELVRVLEGHELAFTADDS